MAWLLLCHAAAVAAWLGWIIYYEVPLNARMIAENGSANDLKAGFHGRRTNVRALVAAPLMLLSSIPSIGSWGHYVVSCLALLVLLAAVFLRTFNPLLSADRHLARFYVSTAGNSYFDGLISRHGWRLQPVLNWTLAGGITLYALLLAGGWYWMRR